MFPSEEMRLRLLSKFRAETARNLEVLRQNLPLISEPNNRQTIQLMFLAAHTIKGNLGMMQLLEEDLLIDLNAPANDLEALMQSLRDQEKTLNAAIIQELETYIFHIENQFMLGQEIQ